MGYYAKVSCNCYKNGLAKPFPLPELEQYFVLTDGFWQLDLPEGYEDPDYYADNTVMEWLWTACEHSEMQAFNGKITRYLEMALLDSVMAKVGWEKLLVFRRERENMAAHSTTSPDAAAWIREELAFLEKQTGVARATALVNSATGQMVQSYLSDLTRSPNYGSGDVMLSFDDTGMVITHTRSRQELFRSKVFEVHLLTPLRPGEVRLPSKYEVEYVALDSDRRCKSHALIVRNFVENKNGSYSEAWLEQETKIQYQIEQRLVDASYLQDTIDSFKEVCEVSVATNNPIYWSD